MNTVTDLASRAVSFITLMQDTLQKELIYRKQYTDHLNLLTISVADFRKKIQQYLLVDNHYQAFKIRAMELVWVSEKSPKTESQTEKVIEYTINLSAALLGWIHKNKDTAAFVHFHPAQLSCTPYNWREVISNVLYQEPAQRVHLANALQYLPIQVVLALGGGSYGISTQRELQVWKMDPEDREVFLLGGKTHIPGRYALFNSSIEEAESLLKHDKKLTETLKGKAGVPLPFELVFIDELEEISKNRAVRIQEQCVTDLKPQLQKDMNTEARSNDRQIGIESGKVPESTSPFANAKSMKLYALALSGGGIRSATFNLGLLQGLAKKGLISRFDYISTVSGGGYIGSWLAAWIKRDGSVTKVNDRLNPEKSPDPFGEELRPIRWLRMFSNYFAPQSSIMSADSWTVGVTWLRNTLLNQLIILFLFVSIFLLGNTLYLVWANHIVWTAPSTSFKVLACSGALLLLFVLLAGGAMRSYQVETLPFITLNRERTGYFSKIIIALAFVEAYLVSAWLFSRTHEASNLFYLEKLALLAPAALACFLSLFLIAFVGGYQNCIEKFYSNPRYPVLIKLYAWVVILFTALFAAGIALLSLAAGWQLIQLIAGIQPGYQNFNKDFYNRVAFTFGLPIVLEVFSITVIARMAFMGRYFPDERREWWGRIGAVVHNLAFMWILLAGSALLVNEILSYLITKWWAGAVTLGGWVALVSTAVKAAFSSKTSGKEEPKTALAIVLTILGKIGPYLFFLGILVFLPRILHPVQVYVDSFIDRLLSSVYLSNYTASVPEDVKITLLHFVQMVILMLVTFLLARQVGVNEFSMHHFYRNRLVRAYLGATRRRTDRQRTSNPFTGFDSKDDVKLFELQNQCGYYGPYPILNTALNASQVTELDRQDRKAESFTFSPLYCGFDFSMARSSADAKIKSYDYAYRETKNFAYKDDDGPGIGTAMAISGAAVNPNQGYHSSPATAFLLTVFNVRMGWWIGNPRKRAWERADPRNGLGYIIQNLIGQTNTRKKFVCLSDGGHFDNMGLYELVRRKCYFIILGDAEQDDKFTCEGLANAIRRCRIDFGAEIMIDVRNITNRDEKRLSKKHYVIGKIRYAGESAPSGTLLYIKSSITGDEPVDVHEYAMKNETFPHQTTGDQFFDEEQFESYRKLGLYIAGKILSDDPEDKENKEIRQMLQV